jgi:hypothetical protein
MEFDHVTNRYLYSDRYIKMIPYFLNYYKCNKYISLLMTEYVLLFIIHQTSHKQRYQIGQYCCWHGWVQCLVCKLECIPLFKIKRKPIDETHGNHCTKIAPAP